MTIEAKVICDRTEWTCPKCNITKPAEKFQIQVRTGKISGWCRECRTEEERQRRRLMGATERKLSTLTENQKLCMICNVMKPLCEFSPSSRGSGGISSYCRPCYSTKYHIDRDQAREAAYKYRRSNRARWLSLHRMHQFKRRFTIEANSDGTVTNIILILLYNQEFCHYCRNFIFPKNRTIDHVIPLSKGGWHSASNLVMACNTCNSSKKDLLPDEFLTSKPKRVQL